MIDIKQGLCIYPHDTIFVEFNSGEVDLQAVEDEYRYLQKMLPDNTIIAINSAVVKSIQIVHNTETNFYNPIEERHNQFL